jgi:hypothetical protein
MKPLILLLLISACSLTAPRTTGTYITSEPSGATVLVVHSGEIYDEIYQYSQKYSYQGKIVSIQGQTPMDLQVPKGAKTQVIVEMNGYKPVEFNVNSKMAAVYYDGKNKACLMDKYWSWALFGIVDKGIRIFRPKIYDEHCTQTRHNYHIKLDYAK